ncbi:MAG: PspA/IM30 family protein [Spirochaetaceae bacterium]|nr:PspA/IM30 family protein [Spirochaetaceae bacterium]
MGIFRRGKDIINSNINAMLDKAEDPEKMIKLMMQELEDTLVDLKSSIAAKMAARTQNQKDIAVLEGRVKRWTERSEMAVTKGRDDLAKEALIEKKKATDDLDAVKKDIDHLTQIIDETKNNILALEEKLQTVVQKHKILIQRAIHAKERKEVNTSIRHATGAQAMVRFNEFENKIERMEAEADMSAVGNSDLESEFVKMETGKNVDAELEALKKSMKKTSAKSEAETK